MSQVRVLPGALGSEPSWKLGGTLGPVSYENPESQTTQVRILPYRPNPSGVRVRGVIFPFDPDIPIVVTSLTGHKWDHEAYLAGRELGQVEGILTVAGEFDLSPGQITVRTENQAQVELVAASHGFPIVGWTHPEPGFVTLRFRAYKDRPWS